jgi:NitT/TauT family transport system substrate-binding protein
MRLRLAALIAALWLAPGLARAADLAPFKVGISAQTNSMLALWMAKDGKFDEAQGIALEIVNMDGGSRGVQVLLSGEIQAMHVGLSPIVAANLHGADLRLIGASSNVIRFNLFTAPGVKSAADLKGGTVGVSTFGSESDIAVTLALQKLGLSRNDVNIVQVGGTMPRLAALIAGQLKAAPLNEPAASMAVERGLPVLVDLSAANTPWLFTGIVVEHGDLMKRRELYTRFLKAYIEGAYLARADEARTKKVIAKEFKIDDPKVIDITYRDFRAQTPPNAEPSRAAAENVLVQLAAAKMPVGSRNLDDYLDTSLIEDLKKQGFTDALKKKYGAP